MSTLKTILHQGELVQVIENRYRDGRVTQRIIDSFGIPKELKVIYIGKTSVGKVLSSLNNQEYLEYMYHIYNQ